MPKGVGSNPESDRMGTSVPSVVVASATPSSHHSTSRPAACSSPPTPRPRASEIAQPIVPRRTAPGATRFSITSRPAKKKSIARPKLARIATNEKTSCDVEHLRADHDPEHDLDDDRGQDEPAVQP